MLGGGRRGGNIWHRIRQDWSSRRGLRTVLTVFRGRPVLVVWWAVYVAVAAGALLGMLALVGRSDAFGAWAFFAVLAGSAAFGCRFDRHARMTGDEQIPRRAA